MAQAAPDPQSARPAGLVGDPVGPPHPPRSSPGVILTLHVDGFLDLSSPTLHVDGFLDRFPVCSYHHHRPRFKDGIQRLIQRGKLQKTSKGRISSRISGFDPLAELDSKVILGSFGTGDLQSRKTRREGGVPQFDSRDLSESNEVPWMFVS